MSHGTKIAEIRLSKTPRMPQSKLARLAGISNDYMHKIEAEKVTNVGIEVLEKIAKALEVNIYEILDFGGALAYEPGKKKSHASPPPDPESSLPEDERKLLKEWRLLSDEDKSTLDLLRKQFIKQKSHPSGHDQQPKAANIKKGGH